VSLQVDSEDAQSLLEEIRQYYNVSGFGDSNQIVGTDVTGGFGKMKKKARKSTKVAKPSLTAYERVVESRPGQNKWKSKLISMYGPSCFATGTIGAVQAAHIRGYAEFEAGRTDPNNGLLLTASVHFAFDNGLLFLREDADDRVFRIVLGESLENDPLFGSLKDAILGIELEKGQTIFSNTKDFVKDSKFFLAPE
jgi:hypothetical protein